MPDTLLTKRAQVKMFETLAVLVVFFFFLIFGASFYFKLQETSLQRELERNTQLRSIQIAQKSLSLPELDCSFAGVQREQCVDVVKIEKFIELLQQEEAAQLDYFKTFEYSTVTVFQVYPTAQNWVLYHRPRGETSSALQLPVLLSIPGQNVNNFGYIEVRVYA